jgi:hypothetical protein
MGIDAGDPALRLASHTEWGTLDGVMTGIGMPVPAGRNKRMRNGGPVPASVAAASDAEADDFYPNLYRT